VSDWDAADESLKSFAHMAVAAQVGCSFCLDVGYFQAQNQNLDMAKASQCSSHSPTSPPGATRRSGSSRRASPLRAKFRPPGVRRSRRNVDGMTGDPFVTHRSLLFTVAYEMLGSAADAEDVLQESWLRWADVDQSQVREPRAYLIRIVTRQALNRLRSLSRRREEYVGEWLPEPLLTGPDVAEDVELAQAVVERFLNALQTGQLQELMEVMAPDVVLIADGGGLAGAALVPIHGIERVTEVLARANRAAAFQTTTVSLNGAPAGRIEIDGKPSAVSLIVENGQVTRIYVMRNPRKLARLDEPTRLAR
jgi:hypothetical protein